MTAQKPPLSILCLYALGQLGWSLASYNVSSSLNYFYLPPETAAQKEIFPAFLPAFSFLGLTIVGLISFSGRLFDGFIDPFIASVSDKSTLRWGKRRPFLMLSAVPLALFSYLVFVPITEGVSAANIWWLGATVFVYYIFLAAYVIPYSALISELGHDTQARLVISTLISVTWALGFLIGNLTPVLQSALEANGYTPLSAFQTTVKALSFVALIFLLMPALFLNEKRYAKQGDAAENFRQSLIATFKNRNFKLFSAMYLLYWLALTFIQLGIIYFVTLLMDLDKAMASQFGIISFFSSFMFYPLMNYLQKRLGKKGLIQLGFMLYCVIFIILLLPIDGLWRFYSVSVLAALPLAIFGILPNTIVADIIHENETETGKSQAGMFYAIAAFMMKVGISFANLLFPSLLLLGRSAENPLGVQAAVVVAFFFCIIGMFVIRKAQI